MPLPHGGDEMSEDLFENLFDLPENLFENMSLSSPSPARAACKTPSSRASPVACAICLSPVSRGLSTPEAAASASRANAGRPHRGRFRTACCKQLFHTECMARFKNPGPTADYATCNKCPLCRSEQKTGLTPARPQGRPQTGFVSGRAMHQAIQQRAAAARMAVQRSLAARQAAEGSDLRSPDIISSPYQEVLLHRGP